MTIVRARIEVGVPRKRRGGETDRDKAGRILAGR